MVVHRTSETQHAEHCGGMPLAARLVVIVPCEAAESRDLAVHQENEKYVKWNTVYGRTMHAHCLLTTKSFVFNVLGKK